MKIVKIAAVSTIALGIAMGAAALSAGPSLAQEAAVQKPRLPLLGKQVCATAALPLTTAGTAVPTGLVLEFTLGAAKPIQLLFSTELAIPASTVVAVTLGYSIDGALPPVPFGPAALVDVIFTGAKTATAYAVTTSLAKGKHTITPMLTPNAAAAAAPVTAGSRCFGILNTGV